MSVRVHSAEEALELVAAERLVTLTRTGDLPSLVGAVAGPVKGSWWSHPEGKRIYAIAGALDDAEDVLVVKLVAGKLTFVHRALWPAIYRVVSDEAWRAGRRARLGAAAARLLADVEQAGTLRMDQLPPRARPSSKVRAELEQSLLVLSRSMHTEKGRHETLLSTWERWVEGEVRRAAKRLSPATARATIALAAHQQPTALDEEA